MKTKQIKASYAEMDRLFRQVLHHNAVLAGDTVGNSGDGWQNHAREMAALLRQLADQHELASRGNLECFLVFPSVSEMIDQF